jgi:hypothetical protein
MSNIERLSDMASVAMRVSVITCGAVAPDCLTCIETSDPAISRPTKQLDTVSACRVKETTRELRNQKILGSHLEQVKSIGAAKDKKGVKSLTVTGLPSTAMILSPFDRTCLMLFRQQKAISIVQTMAPDRVHNYQPANYRRDHQTQCCRFRFLSSSIRPIQRNAFRGNVA